MQVIYYKKTVINVTQLNAGDPVTLLAAQGPHTLINPVHFLAEWNLGDTTENKSQDQPYIVKYAYGEPAEDMIGAWNNTDILPFLSTAQSEFKSIDESYAQTTFYERDINSAIIFQPGAPAFLNGTTSTLTIHMYYSLIATTI